MEEYFVLHHYAAKQGASQGSLPHPFSAPGCDRNHGLGQRLTPWRVMTGHAENAAGYRYSQKPGDSHVLLLTGDDLIQNRLSNPGLLSQSDRHTHHRAWAFPITPDLYFTQSCLYQTWTLDSMIPACPRRSGLGPILSLALIHATVFPIKLQLAWLCGASLLQCTG